MAVNAATVFLVMSNEVCGTVCFVVSLVTAATTVETIANVIRTGNYLYIDLKMASVYFLTGVIWTAYGVLVKDFFVSGSNLFGAMLGLAMVLTHLYYKQLAPAKHHKSY